MPLHLCEYGTLRGHGGTVLALAFIEFRRMTRGGYPLMNDG